MITVGFDAIITLKRSPSGDGLSDRASEAVSAVGTVVEQMEGTGG